MYADPPKYGPTVTKADSLQLILRCDRAAS